MKSFLSISRFPVTAFLISISVFTPNWGTAWGQENDAQSPKVSLTMFIVPEKEACKPRGYQSYASEQASDCQKLTMGNIEQWQDAGITIEIRKIPPAPPQSSVSLGNLFEIVNAYREDAESMGPEDRKSLVLVFEWDSPQTSPVSLKRTGGGRIPALHGQGFLEDGLHWIHHERADAFLPAYRVKWTVTMGGNRWEFKTER